MIYNVPGYIRETGEKLDGDNPKDRQRLLEIWGDDIEAGRFEGFPLEFDGPIREHPANVRVREIKEKINADSRKVPPEYSEPTDEIDYQGFPKEYVQELMDFENTTGNYGLHSDRGSEVGGKDSQTLGFGINTDDSAFEQRFYDLTGENPGFYGAGYGNPTMTDRKSIKLLIPFLKDSENDARKRVPNFDELPQSAQLALTDMSFQMGSTSLGGFPKMINALEKGRWEDAIKEYKNSDYYSKAKGGNVERVKRNLELLEEGFREAQEDPIVGKPFGTLSPDDPNLLTQISRFIGRNTGDTRRSHQVADKLAGLFDFTPAGDVSLAQDAKGEFMRGNNWEGVGLAGMAALGILSPIPISKLKNLKKTTKVKDESGEPLNVYHSSNQEFNEFKEGAPIFFSPDPKVSQEFGKLHGEEGLWTGEFNLNIENLYDYKKPEHRELAEQWIENNATDIPLGTADDLRDQIYSGQYQILEDPEFIEDVIKGNGFDGALVSEYRGGPVSYMVFKNDQVIPSAQYKNASQEALLKNTDIDIPERVINIEGIKHANPGGNWLKSKREHAAEMAKEQGRPWISGAATAYTKAPVTLPVDELRKIKGYRNEKRVPGEGQYEDLIKKVKEEGFKKDDTSITVVIDYTGTPYVLEGNTTISVANDLGINSLPVEVKWYEGGELIDGGFTPEYVNSLIKQEKP